MLLSFSIGNYRSFRKYTSFSFVPASRQQDMRYTLLKESVGKKTYTANSLKILYGPNASGKTNIVSAFDAFRRIVAAGHIRNSAEQPVTLQGAASSVLELMPNMREDPATPTSFDIVFIEDSKLIEYGLALDLGGFLNGSYPRRVVRETLAINGSTIFSRDDSTVTWNRLEDLPKEVSTHIELAPDEYALLTRVTGHSVPRDELLLSNGFRTAVSRSIAELVLGWLEKKLFVVFAAEDDSDIMQPVVSNDICGDDTSVFVERPHIVALAQKLGLSARHLGFPVKDGVPVPRLHSIMSVPSDPDRKMILPSRAVESLGTVRLAGLMYTVLRALETGAVLVADELDASLHPTAMGAIMNLFHDDTINVNNAQLVFNSHNPVYLNRSLCRRDEVWFVCREDDEHGSEHWALSDFGTKGPGAVRNDSDYMRNYLKGAYGAMPDLEFSDILQDGSIVL